MGNKLVTNVVRDLPCNISRYLKRKTRRFNLIPRVEKQMNKIEENPSKAPTYEATIKQVEQLMKELPEKFEKLNEKDENLHKNLENVYVTSVGDNIAKFSPARVKSSFSMKYNRSQSKPEEVPVGMFNSVRAEHFLAAHVRDPKVFTADVLADVYKIDKNVMKNVLNFVKIYNVAIPVKTEKPKMLRKIAEEAIPRGLYEESEVRILERKVQRTEDAMARLYKIRSKMPQKRVYDMNIFEALIALKPFAKKVTKEYLFSEKTEKDDRKKLEAEYINPNEPIHETIITPEQAEKDFFKQQTNKQLEEKLALDSGKAPRQKNVADQELSSNSFRKEENLVDMKAQNKEKISDTA